MRRVLMLASIAAAGCGAATEPGPIQPARSVVTIPTFSPAAGTTLTLPQSYPYIIPGGLVIPRGSGHVSVTVNMSVAEDVEFAQLNVYLLTGGTDNEYCGQNSPDSPTWQKLERGWNTSVTITGFRVYRMPCAVTGFRAILHRRNSGDMIPPTSAQTIAEASAAASLQLLR